MDTKYYKPDISEICVGLECVWTTLNNGFYDEGGFLHPYNHHEDDLYVGELDIFDIKQLFEYYGIDVVDNIRVKYIDEQDFLDLGWKFKSDEKFYRVYELQGEFTYELSYTCCNEDVFNINISDYYTDGIRKEERQIFLGDVKNKTELKKLMKQLNIYEI